MPESKDCLVIVQARLASTRLPAKALLPVGGIPSFVLCARRAANTGLRVLVATSSEAVDDELVAAAHAAGIDVFRGPHDDVLRRFVLACALLPDRAAVVRLTADNVVPDGGFIETVLGEFRRRRVDYLGTSSPSDGLPFGMSAEVFSASALRRAEGGARTAFEREHVTPSIRQQTGSATYLHEGAPITWQRLRCTLDTFEDYVRVCRLFDGEPDPVGVPWRVLVERLAHQSGSENEPRCPFLIGVGGRVHSALTLGTAQLGMTYGIANSAGMPGDEEAAGLLDMAVEAGITALDTARAYGCSEQRIGSLLSAGQRARVCVVTKLDPLACVEADAPAQRVRDAVDASAFRSAHALRQHTIDTLILHRWAHRNAWRGAAWERLLELQAEGLIGRLGASVSSVEDAVAALAQPQVLHLQCPVNVVDARWRAPHFLAAVAARPDVVIHARSTLLQGLLTLPAQRWPDNAAYDRTGLVELLDRCVAELGRLDRADLGLAYVRSLPWVHSLVVGMESRQQLRMNLALAQRPALTAGEREWIERRLPELPDVVVDPANWGVVRA